MTKPMELAPITLLMVENIKANGNLTWEKAKSSKYSKMEPDSKGPTIKIRKTEKESSSGRMEICMREISGIINVRERVSWSFTMEDSTKGNGWMIKCMGSASSLGLMERRTREGMFRTRNRAKEDSTTATDLIMKETGSRAGNMVEGSSRAETGRYTKGGMSMDN
jgi:hypothetical protein